MYGSFQSAYSILRQARSLGLVEAGLSWMGRAATKLLSPRLKRVRQRGPILSARSTHLRSNTGERRRLFLLLGLETSEAGHPVQIAAIEEPRFSIESSLPLQAHRLRKLWESTGRSARH